jgi:hypothetical protein
MRPDPNYGEELPLTASGEPQEQVGDVKPNHCRNNEILSCIKHSFRASVLYVIRSTKIDIHISNRKKRLPMKMFRIFLISAIILNLFFLTGCNQSSVIKTDVVTGKITLDGQPLANAYVNFTPQSGGGNAAYGMTDKDGVYKLQTSQGQANAGTTPGEYLVTIHKSVSEPTGKKIKDEETGELVDESKSRELVPDIYRNPKKSKLSAVVVAGQTNTFDFDLKSK